MKFRTEIQIDDSLQKIGVEEAVFSIGSCFSTELSKLLHQGQLKTFNNPSGTLFNPVSIAKTMKNLHDSAFYTENDLKKYNGHYLSLDHHSSFNSRYAHLSLEKINSQVEEGNFFLQSSQWVVITYGTSFVYELLPEKTIVANCHKIPQQFFAKRLLSHQEIVLAIQETILDLKDICPENAQIIFTISPVRHSKDGLIENQWSKSKLINALHEVIEELDYCHYLPVYEIMMDDLRDYRFYKEDMIHPSEQAVQYIFEKFGQAYFSEETKFFIQENVKILQALNHRPMDAKSPEYEAFLDKIKNRIVAQQTKVKHPIFQNALSSSQS